MEMQDITMVDGEVRVFPRRYFEVLECVGGVPVVLGTFGNEERANDYAANLKAAKNAGGGV